MKAGGPKALGRLIAERREELRKSQDWLATAAGTARSTIQNIERGRAVPRSTTLTRIMAALDLDAATLGVEADGRARHSSAGSSIRQIRKVIAEIEATSATDDEKDAMVLSYLDLHAERRAVPPAPGQRMDGKQGVG